jgi:3-oxoacyl-[acyl-carrier protein] reductase
MSSDRRIAFITGGAGGIGAAVARQFARDGFRVAVGDLDEHAAQAVAVSLDGSGHLGLSLNVAEERSVVTAFDRVEAEMGPVAILAAVAGINKHPSRTERTLIAETSLEDWDMVNGVNARGCFMCVREMARRRTKTPVEHGRIITVASVAAQIGGYQSTAIYIASKGAVLSLTKAAARELAPLGITVNAIAPGAIETPLLREAIRLADAGSSRLSMSLVPVGRLGLPEEVAAAASYLASPGAAYVTGSTIDVNGGLRMQ